MGCEIPEDSFLCSNLVHKDISSRVKAQERERIAPLIEAAQEFVDRCERGEVRSKYTYAKFKSLLKVYHEGDV